MDYPKRVIKEGEKNKTIVKAIQAALNEAGSGPLEGTGVFGPKTKSAVKLFQATHKDRYGNPLEIDGKVGALTWEILFGKETTPASNLSSSELLLNVIEVARNEIGVLEEPPGSNRGDKVEEYLASTGLGGGYFWCAAFVYWCFQQAAAQIGRNNPVYKTAHCMTHWNKTKAKKIAAAKATDNPFLVKPGHIFIINTGGSNGHTGIVESVEGGFIHTIEGNTDPEGGRNGIGVFRNTRKLIKINRGFIEYS